MNNALKYIDKQMQDKEFAKAFAEEKLKLDIKMLVEELVEKIESGKPKQELLESAGQIKRKLEVS